MDYYLLYYITIYYFKTITINDMILKGKLDKSERISMVNGSDIGMDIQMSRCSRQHIFHLYENSTCISKNRTLAKPFTISSPGEALCNLHPSMQPMAALEHLVEDKNTVTQSSISPDPGYKFATNSRHEHKALF